MESSIKLMWVFDAKDNAGLHGLLNGIAELHQIVSCHLARAGCGLAPCRSARLEH